MPVSLLVEYHTTEILSDVVDRVAAIALLGLVDEIRVDTVGVGLAAAELLDQRLLEMGRNLVVRFNRVEATSGC